MTNYFFFEYLHFLNSSIVSSRHILSCVSLLVYIIVYTTYYIKVPQHNNVKKQKHFKKKQLKQKKHTQTTTTPKSIKMSSVLYYFLFFLFVCFFFCCIFFCIFFFCGGVCFCVFVILCVCYLWLLFACLELLSANIDIVKR